MIETIIKWSGVVALVILAIMALRSLATTQSFGTAVDCGAVTCFTTVGVLTSFQVDGTTIFNGSVTQAGPALFTGGVYASSTVQTSGPLVNYTTNTATSTTKLGCIQTIATSTATPIKLTLFASSSPSIYGVAVTNSFGTPNPSGFVVWSFGNCP